MIGLWRLFSAWRVRRLQVRVERVLRRIRFWERQSSGGKR